MACALGEEKTKRKKEKERERKGKRKKSGEKKTYSIIEFRYRIEISNLDT